MKVIMKAKHLHHKFLPHAIFNASGFKDFASLHLFTRTLNDDFWWEEFESEYTEESLSPKNAMPMTCMKLTSYLRS
jgi:hypothetical protein